VDDRFLLTMRAVLFAVIAGLCWGVGEIFTKAALNSRQVGPMAVLLVRALVTVPPALIAYLAAAHLTKTETASWWRTMDGSVWVKLVIGSGLMAGFAGVFFFYAGLAMPGGDISRLRPIAFSLAPASAVILGWLALGEEMSLRKVVATVLILAGIVLLTAAGSHAPARS
jgi:uncharacterized membrane protein